jgi:hypothetical protein
MRPTSRRLDPFAVVVRGVLGLVAGVLVGLPLAFWVSDDGMSWGTLVACSVGAAVLAILWGDRFWEALSSLWRW